jgi:hypothetical protein
VIGNVSAGDRQATVNFTAPANDGGSTITGYTVSASPGGITVSGVAPPVVIMGLTNGTAYTFTVAAHNAAGTSVPSAASHSVTPAPVTAPALTPATSTPPSSGGGGSTSTLFLLSMSVVYWWRRRLR